LKLNLNLKAKVLKRKIILNNLRRKKLLNLSKLLKKEKSKKRKLRKRKKDKLKMKLDGLLLIRKTEKLRMLLERKKVRKLNKN
jgi:hypothetical protein